MSKWVSIPEPLLVEAAKAITPVNPGSGDTDVPRSLLKAIVKYLREDLGCDHSVGICMCSTIGLVEELQLALNGRKTCPNRCEHGAVFSIERFEEAVQEYVKRYAFASEEEARRDLCDFDGMVNCPVCGGFGTVPINP